MPWIIEVRKNKTEVWVTNNDYESMRLFFIGEIDEYVSEESIAFTYKIAEVIEKALNNWEMESQLGFLKDSDRLSECCNALLEEFETPICTKCKEHCDVQEEK